MIWEHKVEFFQLITCQNIGKHFDTPKLKAHIFVLNWKPWKLGGPGPRGAVAPKTNKQANKIPKICREGFILI
jgi:hypothetical protein